MSSSSATVNAPVKTCTINISNNNPAITLHPEPTRSSLLFSSANSHDRSANSSTSSESDPDPAGSILSSNNNSTFVRRNDYRSKSTDHITMKPNPNSSIINNFNSSSNSNSNSNSQTTSTSTTTTTTLKLFHNNAQSPPPTSTKFSNIVNMSQPILPSVNNNNNNNNNNNIPNNNYIDSTHNTPHKKLTTYPNPPVPIPATRFDTITSYVDVIYQQQQQHQELNQLPLSNTDNIKNITPNSSDIVILNPSDGIEGDRSFMATCPHCSLVVMTDYKAFPGKQSRKIAWYLAPLLLCWLPIYCPGFGSRWMDVKHWCPKCRAVIAIYRK